jgi:hypothetical protein
MPPPSLQHFTFDYTVLPRIASAVHCYTILGLCGGPCDATNITIR